MSINSISFGKSYIGSAPVRNIDAGKRELLNFVEYDNESDVSHLKKTAEGWSEKRFGNYINMFYSQLSTDIKRNKFRGKYYGLEDNNENVQAICAVDSPLVGQISDSHYISCIEVSPDNEFSSKNRKYSGVGTSMFREVVKMAKKDKIKSMELDDASGGFWAKMPYLEESKDEDVDLVIHDKNYGKCIKKLDKMI